MPWTFGDFLFIGVVLAVIYGIMALVNRSRRQHPANAPAIPDPLAGDPLLRSILQEARTIAVVGASPDPGRPSHEVMRYLLAAGYIVYPVNPRVDQVLGHKTYPDLVSLPAVPQIVDVFREPAKAPEIARQAVAAGAGTLWLQEGIVSPEAVHIARQGGVKAVMDHCIMKEHRRLIGGIQG